MIWHVNHHEIHYGTTMLLHHNSSIYYMRYYILDTQLTRLPINHQTDMNFNDVYINPQTLPSFKLHMYTYNIHV